MERRTETAGFDVVEETRDALREESEKAWELLRAEMEIANELRRQLRKARQSVAFIFFLLLLSIIWQVLNLLLF